MEWMNLLEQTPRFVKSLEKSLEALAPYLRSMDFSRVRSWIPGARAFTPWPSLAGAFGAGVVLGAAAALLAAPKAGSELRGELKTKLAALTRREANGHGGEVVSMDAS